MCSHEGCHFLPELEQRTSLVGWSQLVKFFFLFLLLLLLLPPYCVTLTDLWQWQLPCTADLIAVGTQNHGVD